MGQENHVAVVVDSAASLPMNMKVGRETGLYIVPMQLIIGGRTYLDGCDLTPTDFYRMQKGMKEMPVTSTPSPAAFMDTFRAASQEASSIVCLTVSSRFSSSYDSARTAIQEAEKTLPDVKIAVLNTGSAAGGEGLITMKAWRVAQCGFSLEATLAAARAVVTKVSLLAFLDTLYYVWKSGRVPRVIYAGTSLMGIKPIFEMSCGEIRSVARPRTASRAAERMLELMRQRVGTDAIHATVMHADASKAAYHLKERVSSEFTCEELFISEFSTVMGSHTGPGLLGIAFWSETDVSEA